MAAYIRFRVVFRYNKQVIEIKCDLCVGIVALKVVNAKTCLSTLPLLLLLFVLIVVHVNSHCLQCSPFALDGY